MPGSVVWTIEFLYLSYAMVLHITLFYGLLQNLMLRWMNLERCLLPPPQQQRQRNPKW